jgi:hypothetical protein
MRPYIWVPDGADVGFNHILQVKSVVKLNEVLVPQERVWTEERTNVAPFPIIPAEAKDTLLLLVKVLPFTSAAVSSNFQYSFMPSMSAI